MRYKVKAQNITNQIRGHLIRDSELSELIAETELKLLLLENALIDYFNAQNIIKQRGYIVTFNKGTSFGNNPALKLKNDSAKLIMKILKELNLNETTESVEDFINNLVN